MNLNDIIDKAKKADYKSPLVSIDELRSSVQNVEFAEGNHISFFTKWRKQIMTITGIGTMLAAAFLLLTAPPAEKISSGGSCSEKMQNQPAEAMKKSDDSRASSLKDCSASTIDRNNQEISNDKMYRAEREATQKSAIATRKSHNGGDSTLPLTPGWNQVKVQLSNNSVNSLISGITTLKLDVKEAVRLGGHFTGNGVSFIWDRFEELHDKIGDEGMYDQNYLIKLAKSGYDTSAAKILVRYFIPASKDSLFVEYNGWSNKDYLPNVPVSMAFFRDNCIMEIPLKGAFLEFTDNPVLKEHYYQARTSYEEQLKHYGSDSVLAQRWSYINNELKTKLLVPVIFPGNDSSTIYWYYPDSSFLAALEPDKREKVQSEWNLINSIDEITEESIVMVCTGLHSEPGYFDVCRRRNGAITVLSTSPNPASGKLSITYSLTGERNITIALHDITGRQAAILQPATATAIGSHTIEVSPELIAGLQPGLYLAAISSERAESAVIRIVLK